MYLTTGGRLEMFQRYSRNELDDRSLGQRKVMYRL